MEMNDEITKWWKAPSNSYKPISISLSDLSLIMSNIALFSSMIWLHYNLYIASMSIGLWHNATKCFFKSMSQHFQQNSSSFVQQHKFDLCTPFFIFLYLLHGESLIELLLRGTCVRWCSKRDLFSRPPSCSFNNQ